MDIGVIVGANVEAGGPKQFPASKLVRRRGFGPDAAAPVDQDMHCDKLFFRFVCRKIA